MKASRFIVYTSKDSSVFDTLTKNRAPRNGADRGLLGYTAHKNNLDKSGAALQLMIHMYVERILIKYRFYYHLSNYWVQGGCKTRHC